MRRSPLNPASSDGWVLTEAGEVSRGYDSNPLTYLSSPDDTYTRFSGSFNFRRSRNMGELDFSYIGGGLLYQRLDTFNQSFHRAKYEQTIRRPRWSIVGSGEFEYLPDAPLFVFGAGENGSSLPPSLLPNDLVLIGNNQPRYSSLGLVEATHSLTPRSSVTASFSYGQLKFVNGGYKGNSSYDYSLGYNHQLTRKQTVGVRYLDKRFKFENSPVTVISRSPAFVFEDRALNRFMAHFEAGPEMYSISGAPYRPVTHWTWALDTGLGYTVRKSTFSLNYAHGTSSGSGVLVGSELHTATARVEQQISQSWYASAEGSWSRDVAITPGLAALSNLTVGMGGVELDHRIFATESVYLRYTYANENRPPSCTLASCAIGLNRQVVELGLKLSHSTSHEIHPQGN
jgi:hypothetical protein